MTKSSFTTLVVGDDSGDGHNKTASYTIRCAPADLKAAYAVGCKSTKIDVTRHCGDYEDNWIPSKVFDRLEELGFPWSDHEIEKNDDGSVCIDRDIYVAIYLWIAKQGNSKLDVTLIDDQSIDIGGYGLFSQ